MKLSHPIYVSVILVSLAILCLFLTGWGLRLFRWIYLVLTQQVTAGEAKLSDFISVTSVSFTIIGAILAYAGIAVQARRSDVEQRSKRYADSIAATTQQIQALANATSSRITEDRIRLVSPANDAELIAPLPYLYWAYDKHSDRINYRIQIISISKPRKDIACAGQRWTFFATEPAVQRSRLLACNKSPGALPTPNGKSARPNSGPLPKANEGSALPSGEYLWRVQPAKVSVGDDEEPLLSDLGEWSEYNAFSVYSSNIERIAATRKVLVGTAYSANPSFSGMDSSSRHVGHDIDLIKILVEGCMEMSASSKRVVYAATACGNTIQAYNQNCEERSSSMCSEFMTKLDHEAGLAVEFRLFSSAGDGLEALAMKSVDVFVGSLTRAEARQEIYNIRFTRGYYEFDSKLYGRHIPEHTTIDNWLAPKDRLVGVVENSTNNWLATELATETINDHVISVVTFKSVPELESAFEGGEVDGVLMDNMLNPDASGMIEIDNLKKLTAWSNFRSRLGFDKKESFAIAVAAEKDESLKNPCDFDTKWWWEQSDDANSLYCPLDHALKDRYDKDFRNVIKKNYGLQ
jgi:ABC-type amino acid transport substrate-binding protein